MRTCGQLTEPKVSVPVNVAYGGSTKVISGGAQIVEFKDV